MRAPSMINVSNQFAIDNSIITSYRLDTDENYFKLQYKGDVIGRYYDSPVAYMSIRDEDDLDTVITKLVSMNGSDRAGDIALYVSLYFDVDLSDTLWLTKSTIDSWSTDLEEDLIEYKSIFYYRQITSVDLRKFSSMVASAHKSKSTSMKVIDIFDIILSSDEFVDKHSIKEYLDLVFDVKLSLVYITKLIKPQLSIINRLNLMTFGTDRKSIYNRVKKLYSLIYMREYKNLSLYQIKTQLKVDNNVAKSIQAALNFNKLDRSDLITTILKNQTSVLYL